MYTTQSYIIHYGMPQRSGRYAWGSGDRPYQRLEKKASRMENRLTKKLNKADSYISKKQKKANKSFSKAIKREASVFASKEATDRAFHKGEKQQRKVNRKEYKTSKIFDRYSKTFDKLDITMDKDLKKRGLDYYNRVINNSKMTYQTVIRR